VRAIGIHEFGGRDKLESMELPEPKVPPDAVKIRIRAAGVNPVDWKLREGRLDPAFPHVFPVVPGWDAAGVVEAVGPSVVEVAPGDEVFAYCRKHFVGEGTYAEYVTVPVTYVAPKPKRLSFEEAGAIPLAGLCAYQALFFGAGLTAGETVLVYGASGGVGGFAVQIAVAAGAEVIAVAREEHREYVLGLGAYEVIDYTEQDVVDAVRAFVPDGVDVVLDVVGGETLARAVDAVRDEGRIVSIVQPPTDERFRARGIHPAYVFVRPDGEQLEELAELAESTQLVVHLHDVVPLEEAARAHQLLENGHVRGKVVLRVE
jgi:NADPH:quinone reductase-like Zn-dependent oxidoreductase